MAVAERAAGPRNAVASTRGTEPLFAKALRKMALGGGVSHGNVPAHAETRGGGHTKEALGDVRRWRPGSGIRLGGPRPWSIHHELALGPRLGRRVLRLLRLVRGCVCSADEANVLGLIAELTVTDQADTSLPLADEHVARGVQEGERESGNATVAPPRARSLQAAHQWWGIGWCVCVSTCGPPRRTELTQAQARVAVVLRAPTSGVPHSTRGP